MIKSLHTFVRRQSVLSRRFAQAAQKQAGESQESTSGQEQHGEQEEEFVYEEYEEKPRTAFLRRAFRVIRRLGYALFGVNALYGYLDSGDEGVSSKRWLFEQHLYRFPWWVGRKSQQSYDFFMKPPMTKFLPDQPPLRTAMLNKTLVLNFEGTMYSKDFEAGQGILLHLRPGFQKFIDEMSKLYEIVIFSEEDSQFLAEAVMTIDPLQRYFTWVFGREFLVFNGGRYVKDLTLLNRDPRKVVVVDFDPAMYKGEPENLVLLEKYRGQEEEDSLRYLAAFLNHLSNPNVKDVRKEIKKFGGTESLEGFKKEVQERAEKLKKGRRFFGGDARKKN